jgi:hypothetical protein
MTAMANANWKTMDTAPRNGTKVLLWATLKTAPAGDEHHPVVGFWHKSIKKWKVAPEHLSGDELIPLDGDSRIST